MSHGGKTNRASSGKLQKKAMRRYGQPGQPTSEAQHRSSGKPKSKKK
jgi:hypothetical protein